MGIPRHSARGGAGARGHRAHGAGHLEGPWLPAGGDAAARAPRRAGRRGPHRGHPVQAVRRRRPLPGGAARQHPPHRPHSRLAAGRRPAPAAPALRRPGREDGAAQHGRLAPGDPARLRAHRRGRHRGRRRGRAVRGGGRAGPRPARLARGLRERPAVPGAARALRRYRARPPRARARPPEQPGRPRRARGGQLRAARAQAGGQGAAAPLRRGRGAGVRPGAAGGRRRGCAVGGGAGRARRAPGVGGPRGGGAPVVRLLDRQLVRVLHGPGLQGLRRRHPRVHRLGRALR